MSAGSLSETATYVLVPDGTTGSCVRGTCPVNGVGEGCGCGDEGCALGGWVGCSGSCFPGERRLSTGRSASSGALLESLVGALFVVVSVDCGGPDGAGVPEGVGDELASGRWSTGRSSLPLAGVVAELESLR